MTPFPRFDHPTGTLWMGDCLELLAHVPDGSVDMVLCDLPYGTTACSWDSIIPFEPLWREYWRVCNGAVVLTAAQPFTSALIMSQIDRFKYCWYWRKNFSTNFLHAKRQPLRNMEDVCVFINGASFYFPIKTNGHIPTQSAKGSSDGVLWHGKNVRNYEGGETTRYPTQYIQIDAADPKNRIHPTQKPVALFEYLILTYTDEGMTVLDNCIGSGTTAIAAIRTGRRWIGIERDPNYYYAAMARICGEPA